MCALVTGVQTCALPISEQPDYLYLPTPSATKLACWSAAEGRPPDQVLGQADRVAHEGAIRPAQQGFTIDVADLRRPAAILCAVDMALADTVSIALRTEEHTSEHQSLMRISYAVFRSKNKNSRTSTEEQARKKT